MSQVLAAPFHGDVPAQALLMVLGTFGWMILLVLALFFSIAFVVVLGRAVVLLMQLVVLGVLVAFVAWTTKQYVATTEQHASGAMIADTDRTKLHCLGMFLLVSLIAWGPLLALLRAASWDLSSASPLELFASSLWGALYWPMGIAMAGAYGIANPVKVVEKVFRTFPAYIAVLMVLVPFVALARAAGAMAAWRLAGLLPGVLGILSGSIVAMILVQYGMIGAFAMLGTLLRKYRSPEQPT